MIEESGREKIRQAMFARNRKLNLANLSRDIGVPSGAVEEFIQGRANLAPEILAKLATYVWGNLVYDASADKLVPAKREEPRSMGIKPEPLEPWQLPTYTAGPPARPPGMVTLGPAKPVRPGWVDQ